MSQLFLAEHSMCWPFSSLLKHCLWASLAPFSPIQAFRSLLDVDTWVSHSHLTPDITQLNSWSSLQICLSSRVFLPTQHLYVPLRSCHSPTVIHCWMPNRHPVLDVNHFASSPTVIHNCFPPCSLWLFHHLTLSVFLLFSNGPMVVYHLLLPGPLQKWPYFFPCFHC